MSEHCATIRWKNTSEDFLSGKYSREHVWEFDGGVVVPASPSPSVVRVPFSNPKNVDPEEAFVAAVSSCHMLTFLYIAAQAGFLVQNYEDEAVGVMSKGENGVPWVSEVTLNVKIVFGGEKQPTPQQLDELHHQSHEQCFIANSIKTQVRVRDSQVR
jgi:organic hydroperoxide reductase OsmC/OhrA